MTKGASRDGMKPTMWGESSNCTLAPLGPAHTTVPTTMSPSASEAWATSARRLPLLLQCRRGTGSSARQALQL